MAGTRLDHGLGSFRTRFTATVFRDLRTGRDKAIWKVVRTSDWGQCWGGGGGT